MKPITHPAAKEYEVSLRMIFLVAAATKVASHQCIAFKVVYGGDEKVTHMSTWNNVRVDSSGGTLLKFTSKGSVTLNKREFYDLYQSQ